MGSMVFFGPSKVCATSRATKLGHFFLYYDIFWPEYLVFGILGPTYLLHYAIFWQKRGAFSRVALGFQKRFCIWYFGTPLPSALCKFLVEKRGIFKSCPMVRKKILYLVFWDSSTSCTMQVFGRKEGHFQKLS